MSKPPPAKYRTTHWKSYDAALRRRGSLMIRLDPASCWQARATDKRDRSPTFSDAAIRFCLTVQGLSGLALRRATGFVESLLKLAGLDWRVPDSGTPCRRQTTLPVMIPVGVKRTGLHLPIDGAGNRMLGEGEGKTKKHGADYRRQWRKVHLAGSMPRRRRSGPSG